MLQVVCMAPRSKIARFLGAVATFCVLWSIVDANSMYEMGKSRNLNLEEMVEMAMEEIMSDDLGLTSLLRNAAPSTSLHARRFTHGRNSKDYLGSSNKLLGASSRGGAVGTKKSSMTSLCEKEDCKGPVLVVFLFGECQMEGGYYGMKELFSESDLKTEGKCVNTTERDAPPSAGLWTCNKTESLLSSKIYGGDVSSCSKTSPIYVFEAGVGQCNTLVIRLIRFSFTILCNAKDLDLLPAYSPINPPSWNLLVDNSEALGPCPDGNKCLTPMVTEYFKDRKCTDLYVAEDNMPLYTSNGQQIKTNECYMGTQERPTMNVQFACKDGYAGRKIFGTGDCEGTPITSGQQRTDYCQAIEEGSYRVKCTP